MTPKQHFFYIIFLLLSQITSTEFNIHSDLILNQEPAVWFFSGQIIRKNPNYSFEICKQKWQNWLKKRWQEVITNITNEIGISEKQFTSLLYEKEIQKLYYKTSAIKKKFLHGKASDQAQIIADLVGRYSLTECEIEFTSNKYSVMTTNGFGSSYTMQCDNSFFNKQNIEYVINQYLSFTKYFSPFNRSDLISCIDMRTLALLIIAHTASQVNHHSPFFTMATCVFSFNQQQPSKKAKMQFVQFRDLRSSLEGVFQSENPLEAALYLRSTVFAGSPYEELQLKFWARVIKDLEQCYHPEDLAAYYEHMKPHLDRARQRLPFE